MKTKKATKMWILGAMATATALSGAVALQTEQKTASADVGFTMEMVDGASVRLVGTDSTTYGIKYTAKIAKESYNQDAKYYVMIIPTGWLAKYELSASYDANCDYYQILTDAGKDASFGNPENRTMNVMQATPKLDGDYYYFNGSITDVKYENSFRDFFGVAYMEVNGVRTYAEFATGENVRSVSQVASAALNDKTNNWNTSEVASLKGMIQKAYNAKNDDDYTTVENEALPTISAESAELSIVGGDTYQIDTLTGVPENIGVKVQYTSSSPAQVTVDENGLISANTVGGGATITATVLGEDYEVAKIAPVENMLVGFDGEESENNAVKLGESLYTDGSGVAHPFETDWLENYDGRKGVLKTMTIAGGNYGMGRLKVAFSKTAAEMAAIDFDYISIWAWVDVAGTYDVKSYNLTLESGLQGKAWQEIRLYASDVTSTTPASYWAQNFGASNARDRFNRAYASDSYKNWDSINELFNIKLANGAAPVKVYIDSISYAKFERNGETPTTTGEYTLPTVTLNDTLATPTISVAQGTNALTVENGKVNLPTVGVYALDYAFNYNGLTYQTGDSVKIANGILEDFSNASTASLYAYQGNGGTHYADSSALSLLGERTGVVGSALNVTTAWETCLNLNFNKTADELKALLCANPDGSYDWDYISFQMYVDRKDSTTNAYHEANRYGNSDGSSRLNYTAKTWCEVKLTREQICGKYSGNTSVNNSIWSTALGKGASATADEVIAKFCEMHCAGSVNSTIFYLSSTSISGIYIDSVSIGKNA